MKINESEIIDKLKKDIETSEKSILYLSKLLIEERVSNMKRVNRLKEEVTLWQGKFYIVKEENNKLRKKQYE